MKGAPPVAQLRLQNVHNRVEITPNGSTGPLVAYDGPDSDGEKDETAQEDDHDLMVPTTAEEEPNPDGPIDMDIDSQSKFILSHF